MEILLIAVGGFGLDLVLGDPEWFPHPVVFMGKAISFLEKWLRRIFPDTREGKRQAGLVLAVILPLASFGISWGAIYLAGLVHPYLRYVLELLWCWQCLAMCCLRKESENVRRCLVKGTIEQARAAVARIVGRDTQVLDRTGITKAAVETVAENFSDGEIAPLLWMMIGGAPLALCYKAINTMDSMVGYKNDRYLDFGRAAAKLDDAANWLPSRFAAILLIAAAPLAGLDAKGAWRIWRRDRRKHASPNSAQTEAAMAGALGVQLAGPASYFGNLLDKPYLGDPLRPAQPEDISRANRLMYIAGFLGLALMAALRLAILKE